METPYEVDLKDQSDWERYLRFNYCKYIRDGKFFEYVFDFPQFTPVDGEPQSCLVTKNIQKLTEAFMNNMGKSAYYGNYNDWLQGISEVISVCRKQRSGVIGQNATYEANYKAEISKSRLLSSQFIELSKNAGFLAPAGDSEKLEWLSFMKKNVLDDLMLGLDADKAKGTLHMLKIFSESKKPINEDIEAKEDCASLTRSEEYYKAKQRKEDLQQITGFNNWMNQADLSRVWCSETRKLLKKKSDIKATVHPDQVSALYTELVANNAK